MSNVCTIMYTHIRSQASDWRREMESVCREREGVCFEIERERECV